MSSTNKLASRSLTQDHAAAIESGHTTLNPQLPPEAELAARLNAKQVNISFLAGDGSDRSYFRVITDSLKTYVLMKLRGSDVEKLKNGEYEWIMINDLLKEQGITTPHLLTTLPDFGVLIIEDYGDETFEIRIKHLIAQDDITNLKALFGQTFKMIGKFINIARDKNALWAQRRFDFDKYLWEFNAFKENFLHPLLPNLLSHDEVSQLETDIFCLSKHLEHESVVFTHRDFHSRNLMCLGDRLAVIDFQDARYGSPSYDLVSLCFDSYMPLTTNHRNTLFDLALEILSKDVSPDHIDQIKRGWKAVFLQRQVKALGSFAFLTIKKQRGDYLKYVKPALETLLSESLSDPRWPFLSGRFLDLLHRACTRDPRFNQAVLTANRHPHNL